MADEKKRVLVAASGFVVQIFMGLIYAWSVFVAPLERDFGWLRSQTSVTFSISLCGFCAGSIAGGILLKKISARKVMWISSAFILLGFVCTSGINTLPGLYICYGVLCGIGVGAGYNAVMSLVLPWFPDNQGAVSGILLMGFGFGGSILGWTAAFLANSFGWRATFALLGIVLGLIVFLLSLLMSPRAKRELVPEVVDGASVEREYSLKEMLKTSSFKMFYLWAIFFSAAGLTIIGHATPIAQELAGDDKRALAVTIAGLASMMNGVGRLSFGFIIDRAGSSATIKLISLGLFVVGGVFLLAVNTGSIIILTAGYIICGLVFGGITPILSTYTSMVFGPRNFPVNISAVHTVLLVSAFIGPSVSGVLQSSSGSYLSSMYMYIACCIIGMPAAWLIRLHSKPRRKKPLATL